MLIEGEVVSSRFLCEKTGLSRMQINRLCKAGKVPSRFVPQGKKHSRFVINNPLLRWIHVTITQRGKKKVTRAVKIRPVRPRADTRRRRRSSGSLNGIVNEYKLWLCKTEKDGWHPEEYDSVRFTLATMIGDFCGRFGYELVSVDPRRDKKDRAHARKLYGSELLWEEQVGPFITQKREQKPRQRTRTSGG